MKQARKRKQKWARKNARGFTLIETVIAVSFFSLLAFALFSTISSASTILQMQTLCANTNQAGTQMLRSISREIAESNPSNDQSHLLITTDVNNNSVVTFQVPVDLDGDGDLIDAANPTEAITQLVKWGAYRFVREPQQQSWLGGWVRYRVMNNQLLREVLASQNGAVLATDIVVPQDVQAFRVLQNEALAFRVMRALSGGSRYSTVLTIRKTDRVNQKGANARTYQATFAEDILLRNGG